MSEESKKIQDAESPEFGLQSYLVNLDLPSGYKILLKDTDEVATWMTEEKTYLESLGVGISSANPSVWSQQFPEISNVFSTTQTSINQIKCSG